MRRTKKISVKKNLIFLDAVLCLLVLGSILVPQVSSQMENIKVLSYSWYINSVDNFVVVGELQNIGQNTLASVFLSGMVYTIDGAAQTLSKTQAFVNYLIPQQKAPFYLEYSPLTSLTGNLSWVSLGIDRVEFSLDKAEATSDYQYPDLQVESSSAEVDLEGIYWVSGTIKNSGTQTASNIRVIGSFYNEAGTVVSVGFTDPLSPTSLSPSGIASFMVGAFDLNQTEVSLIQKSSSYSLLIQTVEPILSGNPPTPGDSTPTPTGSGSENSNTIEPIIIYATVVVAIIFGLSVTLSILSKRRSQSKSKLDKKSKS